MPDTTDATGVALSIEGQWSRWMRRYTWHLDKVPGLLDAMRSDVVRISSDAARYGGERVSSSKAGAPLPFRVEAVDAADDLWAALVQYAENVADVTGRPLPTVTAWRAGTEASGTRVGADVRRDAFVLVAWLIDHLEEIVSLTELGDTEDFLFGLIRSGSKQYLVARPEPRRRCKLCFSGHVVVRWTSTGEIARCNECGDETRVLVSKPVSVACADTAHAACESLGCLCGCHERATSLWTPPARREPVAILSRLPAFEGECVHRAWSTYIGDDELRHCGGCGQVLP